MDWIPVAFSFIKYIYKVHKSDLGKKEDKTGMTVAGWNTCSFSKLQGPKDELPVLKSHLCPHPIYLGPVIVPTHK